MNLKAWEQRGRNRRGGPESCRRHGFVEAADPADEPVRGQERLPRHSFRAVIESECEFEVGGDHPGRIAAAAR